MAINSLPTSLTGAGISSADLYARVSKSLLSQNPAVQKLDATITHDQTRLSALGQLAGMLDNFKAVAESLAGVGLKTAATSAPDTVLTAYTSGSAKPGAHQVEVRQLAQAQTLVSKPVADKAAHLGSGAATTIKIESGGAAKTISLDSTNNTLQGLADAFQAAGVDAKIIRSGSGFALSLTSGQGAANALQISTDGDPVLEKVLDLKQTAAAQDAVLTVDGKQVTSADNDVTGAIPGVALAVRATGKSTVTVAQDAGQIGRNVGLFVDAFNNLAGQLKALQTGELRADPTLVQVQSQLAQLAGGSAGDALAKIGVTSRNGELNIDDSKLKAALAADADAVAKLFTDNGNGLADKLGAKVGQLTGSTGLVGKQSSNVSTELKTLTDKKTVLTDALTRQAAMLVQQYSAAAGGTGSGAGLTGYTGRSSLFDFFV